MHKVITLISVIQLTLFSIVMPLRERNILVTDIFTNKMQNAQTGINEEDFINTMFLKAEFFENWADTNYFINPTLKTAKPLKYNKNWWIDYMQESFKSDSVNSFPHKKFLYLIENWNDNYTNIENKVKKTDCIRCKLFKEMNGKYTGSHQWYLPFTRTAYNFMDYRDKTTDIDILKFFTNQLLIFLSFGFEGTAVLNHGLQKWIVNGNWIDLEYKEKVEELLRLDKSLNFYNFISSNEINRIINSQENDRKNNPFLLLNFKKITYFFIKQYYDVIISEMDRVNAGGKMQYREFIHKNITAKFTERIIFKFEIINNNIISTYQLAMTIDEERNIKHGKLFLKTQSSNILNFELNFSQTESDVYFFNAEAFSFQSENKITHENMGGKFKLNDFLKQFFSNAVVPVFKNRSTFIESGYLDNLEYDTVLINFFGLKELDFKDILIDDHEKKDQWFNILKNIFTVSKNFYKDYLRTLFDLRNETYVQGYNQKYGLLVNNGFKIYPRYFYFSDQYQQLNFTMYSAYKNKFYYTKYGMNFNYDYSLQEKFNITINDGYLLENYKIKHKKFVDRKIGYNIFELEGKKENNIYRYYDFNFGIYNWKEITKEGINPDKQWWEYQPESCSWWNITCHIKNGVVWIVNNIPGVKETNELASGMGKILEVTKTLFSAIFEMWKFAPMVYNTIINTFILIIFMKVVKLL